MNKKLLGLFLTIAIANPIFASCKDIAVDCFFHILAFPMQVIPVGTIEEDDKKRCKTLIELEFFQETKAGKVVGLCLAVGSKLAIIGGATAGIVAVVKHYKKKKQAAQQEVEQPVIKNELVQNQEEQVTIQEVA